MVEVDVQSQSGGDSCTAFRAKESEREGGRGIGDGQWKWTVGQPFWWSRLFSDDNARCRVHTISTVERDHQTEVMMK